MPGNPLTDPNWASEITQQITTVVGDIRDKTTNNAIVAVRAVVYGILGMILGIVILTLFVILVTRALQSLYDIWFEWDKSVWLSYFTLGGIFTIAGALVMTKRHSTDA